MALTNKRFKDQNWSHLRGDQKRGEEGEERKREKKRRRRRRKEEEEEKIKQKGMETTLSMDFVWITWNFKALYG